MTANDLLNLLEYHDLMGEDYREDQQVVVETPDGDTFYPLKFEYVERDKTWVLKVERIK